MPERLSKILIANRGEIAVRVVRTARRLGYRTVAVYSAADAAAPHVAVADEAVLIGPAALGESYLSIERILDAARRSGADAVHPGYGFLSENAAFARACADAGVTFIGPPADAIERMGNKRAAKVLMKRAGVPCVPGYEAEDPSDEQLIAEAAGVGFPLMVKAAAGGGGRGMRLVASPGALPAALAAARAEAKSAFGSGELILERAIVEPRHVEIQIFADAHGNVVHLGERDCSVQRRHQKVIEESPSPAVDAPLRERMGRAAVEAARAVGYVGAGTVELLLADDGSFYFLEMNTRLQVEHPVTELTTGIDLVEWQLRVASGEPLPQGQAEIELRGHAIEARLYAEDPASGFLPQTGTVLAWRGPEDCDVRIDEGVAEGSVVGAFYDPMLAKVIAHGATRDEARRKLATALSEMTVLGVVTNKAFLAGLLEHPAFAAGGATTGFIETHMATHPSRDAGPPPVRAFALAALVVYLESARRVVLDESFIGWRSAGVQWSTICLSARGATVELRITAEGRGDAGRRYVVDVARAPGEALAQRESARHVLEVAWTAGDEIGVAEDGVTRRVRFASDAGRVWVDDGTATAAFEDVTHRPAEATTKEGSGRVVAPLDGAIQAILVKTGDAIDAGQAVVIVEAMKMEHRLLADVTGSVTSLHVRVGQQVKTGQLLCELTPAEGGS